MARGISLEEYDRRLREQRERDRSRHSVPGLDDDELSDEEWEASARNREEGLERRREAQRQAEEREQAEAERARRRSSAELEAQRREALEAEQRPAEGRRQIRESINYHAGRVRKATGAAGRGAQALATGQWKGVSAGGLLLGFATWVGVLSIYDYGPKGLTMWIGSKFANKSYSPSAPSRRTANKAKKSYLA
jgi:hypothetical protein